MSLSVSPISYQSALRMVMQNHYSKIMPRLTRRTLGLFSDSRLVGICTLGWGVRPEHTIRNIFPTVATEQYHEIGKLCVLDEMPKNTESEFLSKVVAWIRKNESQIKILYSWADAIIGKPGYVYQASNFYYGGYIWTEIYLSPTGQRVHARTMQGMTGVATKGQMQSRSHAVTSALGFTKYFGMQLRYAYPLCSRGEWKKLRASSPLAWRQNDYPKFVDLRWEKQVGIGRRLPCDIPPFVTSERISKDKDQIELFAAEVSTATRQTTSLQSEVQALDAAPNLI